MQYRQFRSMWFSVSAALVQTPYYADLCRQHKAVLLDLVTDDQLQEQVYGVMVALAMVSPTEDGQPRSSLPVPPADDKGATPSEKKGETK